jgi:hypothetical protein
MGERGMGAGGVFQRKEERRGSVEIIVLHNVLGDVCHSRREGKLEKMSIRTSSIYIAPATAALKKWSDDHFYESAIQWRIADIPPCDIHQKPVHHGSLEIL